MRTAIVSSNPEKYEAVRKVYQVIGEMLRHCRAGSVKHACLDAELKRVKEQFPEDVFDMALFFPSIMETIDREIETKEKNLQKIKDKFNADPLYTIEWQFDNIARNSFMLRDLKILKTHFIESETYHDFVVFFEEMMKNRRDRLMNFYFSYSTSHSANAISMCEYEHMKDQFSPSQSFSSTFGRIAYDIKEYQKLHSMGKIINADKIKNPYYVKPEEKV